MNISAPSRSENDLSATERNTTSTVGSMPCICRSMASGSGMNTSSDNNVETVSWARANPNCCSSSATASTPSVLRIADHKMRATEMICTVLPVCCSRVANRRMCFLVSNSEVGSYRKIANGRSWYALIFGGVASRSFSRASIRSVSNNIGHILKAMRRKINSHDLSCGLKIQEAIPVGFQEHVLNHWRCKQKQ